MELRSYNGRSVAEAISKCRKDLGDEALIVETRRLRRQGMMGADPGYEVVAAGSSAVATAPDPSEPTNATGEKDQSYLGRELSAIRRQLDRLLRGADGVSYQHCDQQWVDAIQTGELPEEYGQELDEALAVAGDRLPSEHRLSFAARFLAQAIKAPGPSAIPDRVRLLLVGPTGAGKTTTIAKLAARAKNRGKTVALITLDTYRVGACEQIATYGELLQVPTLVARDAKELKAHLQRCSGTDTVLIDSAGRNPNADAPLSHLREIVHETPGIEVALCTPASCGRAEFAAVVERFSLLPIEHAIVTKYDECRALGRLYGCLRRHRLPWVWTTDGQEVPDDLREPNVSALCRAVLGRRGDHSNYGN